MKMKQGIFSIAVLTTLLTVLIAPCTALAAAEKRYIVDNFGAIDERALLVLNDRARSISLKYNLDVAFFLMDNDYAGPELNEYAEKSYREFLPFGSGFMLFYNRKTNLWSVITAEIPAEIITKDVRAELWDAFRDGFNAENTYYSGVMGYLNAVDKYLASRLPGVGSGSTPAEGRMPRFIDDLGLVTPTRAARLTAKLDEISERHQFDVVVAVVSYSDDEISDADFYKQNRYGFGSDLDRAILLFSIDQYGIRSKFRFFATGFGSKAFTTAGREYLLEQFKSRLDLGRRNYFEAFIAYADDVDDFLTQAKTGKPYDVGNIPLGEPVDILHYIAVNSLGPLLVVALIVMEIWKSRSKAVRRGNH